MLNRKRTPKSQVKKLKAEKQFGDIIRDAGTCLQCGKTMDVADLPRHNTDEHRMKPPKPRLSKQEQQEKANRDLQATMEWLKE